MHQVRHLRRQQRLRRLPLQGKADAHHEGGEYPAEPEHVGEAADDDEGEGDEDRLGELDGPAAVVEAVEEAGESPEAVRADIQHRGYLNLGAHRNADRRRGVGDDNELGDEEGERVCQREASLQLVDEEDGDGKSE